MRYLKSPWRRCIGSFLILTFSAFLGCSTVRTLPDPSVQQQLTDEQQKAIEDFNRAAEGKKATLRCKPLRFENLTPEQAESLVGQRIRFRIDGKDQAVWVKKVEYPMVSVSDYRHSRSSTWPDKLEEFDVRDLGPIEIDGPTSDVRSAKLSSDSLVWAFGGDKGDGIVCQEVESITLVDRGLGVLEGVGLGFLIGGGSGVFLGFVSGDDSEGWFAATAEEKAVGLGVFLGVLGGICGLIAGAAKGHVDIYELDDADSRFLNPTTPPLGGSRRVDRIGGNSRIEWTSSSDRLVVVIRF